MQDSHPTAARPATGAVPGLAVLSELCRTQAAIGVALALLDELLQLSPEQPDAAGRKEIEDVFREIRDLASTGLRTIRKAANLREVAAMPGHHPG